MNDLVLKNCKLINSFQEYNIGIVNGRIGKISKQPLKSDDEIDINGKIVLPGLIDPHVHFRDPGLTYKENFRTGSLAAANGGFTTVIDMPNTIPLTNTYKNFKEKVKIGENKSIIDFSLHSGFNNLKEMEKIADLKPASFKIFMDLEEDETLEDIFKNISLIHKKYDYQHSNKNQNPEIPHWKNMITAHCENKAIVDENTSKLKKQSCIRGNTAIDYSYARPSKAEDISIKQAIDLAKKYEVKLHICHLSSKKSLAIVKRNKPNLELSFESTPHHLFLDSDAFNKCGTIAKTNPPLRLPGENLILDNINDIDMIGTDHAPHTLEEKQKGVWDSNPGIPNLETTLPLLLTQVNRGKIDISLIPKILSENPAKIFNLPNKGSIELGKDADLIVVDLKKEGKFNLDNFYTKAKYSPLEKYRYKGTSIMTIANGKVIVDDGDIMAKNKGKYLYN